MSDRERFVSEDLVLRVASSVDPARLDLAVYDPFLDLLCGTRTYQKEAIQTAVLYMGGGRYSSLRDLADENYTSSERLRKRYKSAQEMHRNLPLLDKLSCSIDLATGTGKSYVMYGVSAIMMASGLVDRTLVLCPSTTIERGLAAKFRDLASRPDLRDALPGDSGTLSPHIIDGSESLVAGTLCIENYHAILPHVRSSIRGSLAGKGGRVLVLNDEVHHVHNKTERDMGRWREFLLDDVYGFRYICGLSGTCYVGNDYFADVVYRYSLRDAIQDGYVKSIDYVAEDTSHSDYERLQKIYDNHAQNRAVYRNVKPITILVTRDIRRCSDLADQLVAFLSQHEHCSVEDASKKVLAVTSSPTHARNIVHLDDVDRSDDSVEWITSVSMLTEGWDVKNVFQIVPHEERAFNSKLLIAQVLGRGLRIPESLSGERPVVTVFNHDAWSGRIKHLVDDVLEIDKRLTCYPVTQKEDYSFSVHQVDYTKVEDVMEFPAPGEYEFAKGYVTLASQLPIVQKETIYSRAVTGEQRVKKTHVSSRMFSVDEVAKQIHRKLTAIDVEAGTSYGDHYDIGWLRNLVSASLARAEISGEQVSEENRQRLLKAFGVIHRQSNKVQRFKNLPDRVYLIGTTDRPKSTIAVSVLRRGNETVFLDEQSAIYSDEDTRVVLEEILQDESLPRSAWERIDNAYLFKTPLNLVFASHRPERDFVRRIVRPETAKVLDSWIKSPDQDFYSIEFSWRKGDHVKRGLFNPDFFIRVGDHTVVVEIKSDEDADQPSDENRAKYRAARKHFQTLNTVQDEVKYEFHFLTPRDYDLFFKFLQDRNFAYTSTADVAFEGA